MKERGSCTSKLLVKLYVATSCVNARFDRQRAETKSLRRGARSTAKTAVVRPSVRPPSHPPSFLQEVELSAEGNNSILALLFAGTAKGKWGFVSGDSSRITVALKSVQWMKNSENASVITLQLRKSLNEVREFVYGDFSPNFL